MTLVHTQSRSEQEFRARRLCEDIEQGRLQSEGQINNWCTQVWYLPIDLKHTLWRRLSARIDHSVYKTLRKRVAERDLFNYSDMVARRGRNG